MIRRVSIFHERHILLGETHPSKIGGMTNHKRNSSGISNQ